MYSHRASHHPEPRVYVFVLHSFQRCLVSFLCELVQPLGHALRSQPSFTLLFVLHAITFTAESDPTGSFELQLEKARRAIAPFVAPAIISQRPDFNAARGGLITTATTPNRFPVTGKRYFRN